MGFRVEDGKGRGRFVSVNEQNRMDVAAVVTTDISDAAHAGNAYSVLGSHTMQAADTDENILFLVNNSSNLHMHLQSLRLAAKTSTGVIGKSVFEVTYTSGGVAAVPVQLNRGSAKASNALAYTNTSNDLVLGITELEEFARFRAGATGGLMVSSEGAIILGPGNTFAMRGQGAIGDIIEVAVFFYEIGEES